MFKQTSEGVLISLYVLPNAPKSEVIGEYNGSLKIKIKAPPVEGKANDEIVAFFSKYLGIAKNKIEIQKGDKSKNKKVIIYGANLENLKILLLK